MSARHYYRIVAGTLVEQTDRIPREGWQTDEKAEEGAVGSTTIVVVDPAMDQDYTGHRRWLVIEDESESTDDVLYSGYTGAQEISRGESETFEPLGRVWAIELYDVNTVLSRRVLRSGKRPAETDVERVQWLLGSAELSPWLENVTDYVSTANPVDMDKVDYTGQMTNAVWDDCAQQSGKNWFVRYINNGVDRELCAFYGDYTYDSPLSLSNDPSDWVESELADGTSLVYPISGADKLRRDPSRVFSGGYLEYEKGRVYRRRAATETAFALGHRDMIVPAGNVKTKAKAIARVNRALVAASTEEERITGSVRLPKGKATMLKPGMMVRYKATHMPGYETARLLRVIDAAPAPVAAGAQYDIAYTLLGPGEAAPWVCPLDSGIGAITAKTYENLGGTTSDSDGLVWYANSNLSWFTDNTSWDYRNGPNPSNANVRGLGFPSYDPAGDGGGSGVASLVGFLVTGPGTATSHWGLYVGAGAHMSWSLKYHRASGDVTQDSGTFDVTGDDSHVVTVPDLPADADSCYRHIVYKIEGGISGGSGARFRSLDWVNA